MRTKGLLQAALEGVQTPFGAYPVQLSVVVLDEILRVLVERIVGQAAAHTVTRRSAQHSQRGSLADVNVTNWVLGFSVAAANHQLASVGFGVAAAHWAQRWSIVSFE